MLRRSACVLWLAICLNGLVGLANDPSPRAVSLPDGDSKTVEESAFSVITPYGESALSLADLDLTGFLAYPWLITSEPALLQLHAGEVTHQRWQRFGIAAVAPFVFSRSLPLQI